MVPNIDMSNYDQYGCLHDLFTKKAAETPNSIAVVTSDNKKVKNLVEQCSLCFWYNSIKYDYLQ